MTETADDLRADLKRNHPELTPTQLDNILNGPPPRRRRAYQVNAGWFDNKGRREPRGIHHGRTNPARWITRDG